MALALLDRARVTSTTTGTGTITLGPAVVGFQDFSSVGNGNTTYYAISDLSTNDWEVGIGTYSSTGPTLARTAVLASSNGGSLVSLSGYAKDVFITLPSSKAIPFIGTAAPTNPSQAQTWWDSETGDMYLYYPDVSGNQFVSVNSGMSGVDLSDLDGGSATTITWIALIFNGGSAT